MQFVNPRLVWLIATVALLGGLAAGNLRAHQDPVGDVHPTVRVENGQFAVYFGNNTNEDARAYFRMLYSPAGKLLAPRHQTEPLVWPYRNYHFYVSESDGRTYEVPRYRRLLQRHSSDPYYPYYLVEEAGKRLRHKIPWPDEAPVDGIRAMRVADGALWLTVYTEKDASLTLAYHRLCTTEPVRLVKLGTPATIYHFPVTSNIGVVDGSCFVAWCRAMDEGCELVLSKWDGVAERATDRVLSEDVDFNLSISLATIGNRLCIAYHRSRDGDYPGRGVVEVLFHEID